MEEVNLAIFETLNCVSLIGNPTEGRKTTFLPFSSTPEARSCQSDCTQYVTLGILWIYEFKNQGLWVLIANWAFVVRDFWRERKHLLFLKKSLAVKVVGWAFFRRGEGGSVEGEMWIQMSRYPKNLLANAAFFLVSSFFQRKEKSDTSLLSYKTTSRNLLFHNLKEVNPVNIEKYALENPKMTQLFATFEVFAVRKIRRKKENFLYLTG